MRELHPTFRRTLRGYDPAQVEGHLAAVGRLLDEAWDRARGPADGLREAALFARSLRRQAEADAAALLDRARAEAADLLTQAQAEADRIRAAADRSYVA